MRRTGKRVDGDADDREHLPPQPHGASDEVGVPAEARRPGAVGHDGHRRRARVVVPRRHQPAVGRRRRPEHHEEVAGHQGDVHPGGGAPGNQREVEDPESREGERLRFHPHLAQPQVRGMAQR